MPRNPDRLEPGADGSTRKAHYGAGEQPWDVIVRKGWGPQFAAANVLQYLRRTKDPEHSLESARWYYRQLMEMADNESGNKRAVNRAHQPALTVFKALLEELTGEEFARVDPAMHRVELAP